VHAVGGRRLGRAGVAVWPRCLLRRPAPAARPAAPAAPHPTSRSRHAAQLAAARSALCRVCMPRRLPGQPAPATCLPAGGVGGQRRGSAGQPERQTAGRSRPTQLRGSWRPSPPRRARDVLPCAGGQPGRARPACCLAQEAGVLHKLWVEQPENYPTCLATKPYRRSQASAHFKKLQLCKAALEK